VVETLDGRRMLVVGASQGLGRAIALRLLDEGASVAIAARGIDRLNEMAPENERVFPIACDVRDPSACNAVVASAVDRLGGLDGLIYAPGLTVLTELWKATPDHWRVAFETNVIGAGLVTAAAVPHLDASKGAAIYLSSVSAHLTPPWIGMGLYLASKVALEKCVEVWKLEHRNVRFTTIVIGSTGGTSFFANAEKPYPDDIDRFSEQWKRRGYLAQEQLAPEDQANAVVDVLRSGAQIDVVWVRPVTSLQLWD